MQRPKEKGMSGVVGAKKRLFQFLVLRFPVGTSDFGYGGSRHSSGLQLRFKV